MKLTTKNLIKRVLNAIFLMISVAGGVLFSFGLNDWIGETWSPMYSVIIGASVTILAIILGFYTTETAFAMKKRK
jgi:hypothetical protein